MRKQYLRFYLYVLFSLVTIAGIIVLYAVFSSPVHEEKIRIGYLRIGSSLALFVGEEAGIFEKHGISVTGVRLGDSNIARDALLSGEIDATDVVGSNVVFAAAIDNPDAFRIFMASLATENNSIHNLLARVGSGVESVADLKGRRLAVFPGTQMRAYVTLFLTRYMTDVEISQVELVPLTPPQQIQAMHGGQVDAVLALEPTGTQLLYSGIGTLILSNVLFETISKPAPFVTAFALVRKDWASTNPEMTARLVDAYREIAKFIREQPDDARSILDRKLNLGEEVAADVSLYEYAVTPHIDVSLLEETAQLMVVHGVLSRMPDVRRLMISSSDTYSTEGISISGS